MRSSALASPASGFFSSLGNYHCPATGIGEFFVPPKPGLRRNWKNSGNRYAKEQRTFTMNDALSQTLAKLDLQPGQCQVFQVNGYRVEIRRPTEEESDFSGMAMLEAWEAFP
jgi:hypothetical protein